MRYLTLLFPVLIALYVMPAAGQDPCCKPFTMVTGKPSERRSKPARDVNSEDSFGATPLMHAGAYSSIDVMPGAIRRRGESERCQQGRLHAVDVVRLRSGQSEISFE